MGDEWTVSDSSWQSSSGEAWTPVPMLGDVACLSLESFDARAHCWGLTDNLYIDVARCVGEFRTNPVAGMVASEPIFW